MSAAKLGHLVVSQETKISTKLNIPLGSWPKVLLVTVLAWTTYVLIVKKMVSGLFLDSWPSWFIRRDTSANTMFYLAVKALSTGELISLQGGADHRGLTFMEVRSDKCTIRLGAVCVTVAQLLVSGTWVQ